MNTIPSIFNEHQINCTILGAKEIYEDAKMNVSVILLNSGGTHLRLQNLYNLIKCGFKEIVSVETNAKNYNLEGFIKNCPSVKFVLPLEDATQGDLINLGMNEVTSDYVLVLRDTLNITPNLLQPSVASKLISYNNYCVVPKLLMDNYQPLPIRFSPIVKKSVFEVDTLSSFAEGAKTLYPSDFIGFYDRKKFIQLGGFDYTITNPYWQNLDLSVRAWLWGEKISLTTIFQIAYSDKINVQDSSPDESHIRFYLKNLLPKFKIDHGSIPMSSFFLFQKRSTMPFWETRRAFKDAVRWTELNQFRFKGDAQMLIDGWDESK